MFIRGLVFLLMLLSAAIGNTSPSFSFDQLCPEDQSIYKSTFAKCQPGTPLSAIRLGLDKDNFVSGVDNWMQIISLNLTASESRTNSNGLTPRLKKIQSSPGFWLAMTTCYGYQYGKFNYGNLMKQIVDLGHLTTEVSAASTGAFALISGAKMMTGLTQQYPIAGKFVITTLIAFQTSAAYNKIRYLLSEELTPQELKNLDHAQSIIFAEPNRVIAESLQKYETVINRIDEKLQDTSMTTAKRDRLLELRVALQTSINKMSLVPVSP
jgi:hypothetical protein